VDLRIKWWLIVKPLISGGLGLRKRNGYTYCRSLVVAITG